MMRLDLKTLRPELFFAYWEGRKDRREEEESVTKQQTNDYDLKK
jgi:hypothetical protein